MVDGLFRLRVFREEGEIDFLQNLDGVFQGLGVIREDAEHLFPGFEVKLLGLELHGRVLADGLSRLEVEENLLYVGVLFVQVVAVVGGDQGDPRLLGEVDEPGVDLLLALVAVVHELEVELSPEGFIVPEGRLLGLFVTVLEEE